MVPAAYLVNSVPVDVSTSVRDATTTLAPCPAKPRHIARPMPRLPPVTSATLSCNVIAIPCAGATPTKSADTITRNGCFGTLTSEPLALCATVDRKPSEVCHGSDRGRQEQRCGGHAENFVALCAAAPAHGRAAAAHRG